MKITTFKDNTGIYSIEVEKNGKIKKRNGYKLPYSKTIKLLLEEMEMERRGECAKT